MLKRDRSFRLHQSNHVTTSLFWHQWEFNLSESVTPKEGTRRDFIYYATGATGAVTGGAAVWALINQMNPSSDVQALSTIEVDIGGVEPGTQLVVKWLGKPVFIRRRTQEEIIKERKVEVDGLIDPLARNDNLDGEVEALDVNRTIDEAGEWLVMIGVCTHLGCVPLSDAGDFKGWFCPCHGSHYDLSGRIRRGPAPQNLEVPRVTLVDENTIRLG